MVPDKFNMVDMGGIDLIMMQGEEVPGLYNRLVESIAQCRYQCLYNWLFDGVIIPPTYVEVEVNENEEVEINEGVVVTSDDVIHIHSIEPPAPEPEIIPLLAEENGTYNAPTGVDGFNPVTVDVPSYTPIIQPVTFTENGNYSVPSEIDGYGPVIVNVPSAPTGVPFVESQGTTYFNTGIAGNTVYKIEYEFMPVSVLSNYQWYVGALSNNFTVASMTTSMGANSGFIRVGNIDFGVVSYNLGQVNKLVCDNGSVYLNNTQISGSYSGPINTTAEPIKFLGGIVNSYSRMFSCKLYDQSNTLIADYVPFLDSNYVACLKNNVSDSILYPTARKLTFGYAINGGF